MVMITRSEAEAIKKQEKIYFTRQTRSSQKNLAWDKLDEDLSLTYFIHYENKFLSIDGDWRKKGWDKKKIKKIVNELYYEGSKKGNCRHPVLAYIGQRVHYGWYD